MTQVDEEFFIPQNVAASYALLGLGPRHLKRAAWGAGIGFAGAMVATVKGAPLPLAMLGATLLFGTYAVAYVWPMYAGDLTLLEQMQELRWHRQRQTVFPFRRESEEVNPCGAVPGAVSAALRRMEASAGAPSDRSGMA